MSLNDAIARFERLYMFSRRTPVRQILAGLFAFAIGSLVAVKPMAYAWPILIIVLAWGLLIGPFLGTLLPFSTNIRDYWRQQREQRGSYLFGFPYDLIASGCGFLLAAVTAQALTSKPSSFPLIEIGAVFLGLGIITFVVARVARYVRNR